MDKDKITEEVLADWAMRSPDGLSAGHNTPTNAAILQEMLGEMAKPTSQKMDTGRRAKFSLQSLVDDKQLSNEIAQKIFDTVMSSTIMNNSERTEFIKEVYDNKESINDAMDYWNPNLGKYAKLLNVLDEDFRANKVGRGEYALVLSLRGCKSGGQQSGDLILRGGGVADVKELDKNSAVFRTTEAVFGNGGFGKIPFVAAMNDLMNFCKKNPLAVPFFKDLCDKAKLTGTVGGTKGQHAMTNQFFETLSWGKVNWGAINGLMVIDGYLHGMTPEQLDKLGSGENVKFELEDESVVLSVNHINPDVKQAIANPDLPPTKINVTVSAFDDETNQLLMPQIKRLPIFKNSPTDRDFFMHPVAIAKSMFAAMEHYDKGIVFYRLGNGFSYEKEITKSKNTWVFYGYQQVGPAFARLK